MTTNHFYLSNQDEFIIVINWNGSKIHNPVMDPQKSI